MYTNLFINDTHVGYSNILCTLQILVGSLEGWDKTGVEFEFNIFPQIPVDHLASHFDRDDLASLSFFRSREFITFRVCHT